MATGIPLFDYLGIQSDPVGSGYNLLSPTNQTYQNQIAQQDPTKVFTSLNGVDYNFAGDPIGPTPVATATTGGSVSGGGGGVAAPVIDPAVLASYDQAINNTQAGIDRLPNQLNSGFSGIDASYQNALNQLLLGKNQGETAYNTNKQQTATGYVGTKNTIGANAGESLTGLQRLLGSRGAGGGSAYNIAAPQAVARGATLQRAGAAQNFGQNNQALDTNWNNYLTGYNNQVSSAGAQRDQAKQGLQSSIDTNRASLLQTLAQLQAQRTQAAGGNAVGAAQPYLDQANALLDKTANYQVAPINYQTQAYQAPNLASYTPTPQPTPTYDGSTPNDYFSPYLAALLGKKSQQLGLG